MYDNSATLVSSAIMQFEGKRSRMLAAQLQYAFHLTDHIPPKNRNVELLQPRIGPHNAIELFDEFQIRDILRQAS